MNFYLRVYKVVRAIPRGQVTSYGAIAAWLGAPRAARAVGYALAADLSSDVPWHRVVNVRGEISEGGALWRAPQQQQRLIEEGIVFSADGKINLKKHSFRPTSRQLRRWAHDD